MNQGHTSKEIFLYVILMNYLFHYVKKSKVKLRTYIESGNRKTRRSPNRRVLSLGFVYQGKVLALAPMHFPAYAVEPEKEAFDCHLGSSLDVL